MDTEERCSQFKVPRFTCLVEILVVSLCAPFFVLGGLTAGVCVVILTTMLIGSEGLEESPVLWVCVAMPVFLSSLVLWWMWARRRLRFTLRIGDRELVYGKGPFRQQLTCDDVETIREREDGHGSHWVEILGGGRTWNCHLGATIPPCIEALRSVCGNAIYIDARGVEHFPERTREPERVVGNLVRARFRIGIAALSASILLLAWTAVVLAGFIIGIAKGDDLGELVSEIRIGFILLPFVGLTLLFAGISNLRKARRLAAELAKVNLADLENADTEDGVDLSKSGIEKL